ncbi:MAG TPA: hypothetical protein VKG92_11470, partial [Flavobacteriales bacterium]|nr:hypothetical protein [Flavobacteriales bacterium]
MNVVAISVMNVMTETVNEILQTASVLADGFSSPFRAAINVLMEAKVTSPMSPHNTRNPVFFGGIEASTPFFYPI